MIDLYTFATPNGQKASIALEELELPYRAHTVDITKGEQHTPEHLAINPNGKIPAIVDQEGPGGKPLAMMESGAVLIYLADKAGKLLSKDPVKRSETLQWLFFQVGHVGPMLGQFGHFHMFAKDKCDHPYPLERYRNETKRLLGVLDQRLKASGDWLVGEYSIADIATVPWINGLDEFYKASAMLDMPSFEHLQAWRARFMERPAVQRGYKVGTR